MKTRLLPIAGVAAALLVASPSAASVGSSSEPCAAELKAFSSADRAVVKTQRALRKAKTPKGKSRLRRRLAAQKRSVKRAERAHDRCGRAADKAQAAEEQAAQEAIHPGLYVTPSPRIIDPIQIRFVPASAPPIGTEYHIGLVMPRVPVSSQCGLIYIGTISATAQGFSSVMNPRDSLMPNFQNASYWCAGTAEVIVRLRAVGSPATDLGIEQARVTILISVAA